MVRSKNRKFVTPKQLCDIGKCGKHGELKIILESYFNEHQAQQEAHPDLQRQDPAALPLDRKLGGTMNL